MNSKTATIILNYFDTDSTIKCVESVQKELDTCIFLVDNSADVNEAARLSGTFSCRDNIHLLFPKINLGFAAGVNLAVRQALEAGFKRFLLLNNDAVLLGGAGQKLGEAYCKWPGALIAPTIRWGDRLNKGYYYHRYLGLIIQNSGRKQNGWLHFLSGCALAFDESFLNRVGYLNETFFMYGEDVDICYRAQARQTPLVLLDDVLVLHAGSHSSKMASYFYEYHMLRSHFRLCFLLFNSPFEKAMALFGKTITMTIRSIYRSIKYLTLSPITALLSAPLPLKIRPKGRSAGS